MAPKNSAVYSTTDGAVDDGFPDRIAKAFENKRVLITGGTGFLGKVLIEKILRKCEKIDKIIVLARPKKGKNPKQRIEEMFHGPLFTEIVKKLGMEKILSKIVTVNGDTGEMALGLSPTDRGVCRSAHFIIHSAATVRFDEGLKRAVIINVRGTRYMLDLAKECENLEIFVHISTAYCHPEQAVLEEVCYPPPADPHSIIHSLVTMDDITVEALTPKILGNYPNTYAYSKALGEALAEEAMQVLPVMILRPSVVIPIYKEPLPGWTDNLNGPIGLLIGGGKGVLRTMYGNDSGHADFIPADIVVNVIMVALWDYVVNGIHHKVLNLTSSAEIHVSWREVLDIGRTIATEKYPFDNVAWYPGGCMTSHRWLHHLRALLFHWLPALLVDTILFCLGLKPVLIRVHKRIHKGSELIEFYTSNQWVFKSDFGQQLRNKLNPIEKVAYKMDAEDVDIVKYFENGVLAARRYILKEKDENLPRARLHIRIMYFVDIFVKIIFYGLLFNFIFNKVHLFSLI